MRERGRWPVVMEQAMEPVLLAGMDGTGRMFGPFVRCKPADAVIFCNRCIGAARTQERETGNWKLN